MRLWVEGFPHSKRLVPWPDLWGRVTAIECDIAQQESVREVSRRIESELGSVEVLVNAAGTNAPERALEVLSDADYRLMMDTNLNGAYYCVQAFLPGMRNRGSGTIVNIISDAGKQVSRRGRPM